MSGKQNAVFAGERMRAVICQQYSSPDVLRLAEMAKPRPRDNEVLIKVYAASLNAYDWHLLRADPFFVRAKAGLFKPRNTILGGDIAGVVETAGSGARRFKPGDAVYGCLESCGAGGLAAGGLAKYVCAREGVLAPKPPGVTFEQAAATPMAAVTALQGLRDAGRIKHGTRVLINGASGGVGTFAVQIAKAFGAEVTGVCSAHSSDMVRAIGADVTVDYAVQDFSRTGQRYDLILDIAANHTVADYRRALCPEGLCVVVGFSALGHTLRVALATLSGTKYEGKRIVLLAANNTDGKDLVFINALLEAGKIVPIIDRHYPLTEAANAIRYIETGHPKGKVVVVIGGHATPACGVKQPSFP
ncbi:MAG: NAD(P)-dependent alcohol dehydrogenase [Oscillospiraceae bacterium]|jgi:NADPH:quinone reductase-like Zn-dependent oxidoreductase|nr:NAD(P)-dependent alcohol dehydrogenase [Oscillospiraceae bacterium]